MNREEREEHVIQRDIGTTIKKVKLQADRERCPS
jgi:hypothetical protein